MLFYTIQSTARFQSVAHISYFPGFFVDINLFKANKERAAEIAKSNAMVENGSSSTLGKDALADEDANLMIKLKFLTYKVSFLVFLFNLDVYIIML